MFKVILTMKRVPGLSRQEFIDAYENRHVPLIKKHVGKYMLDYRRNFLVDNDPNSFAGPADASGNVDPGPDVVTEILIKDRATLDAMFADAGEPNLAAEIAADANSFIDRPSVRRYIMEVYPRDPSRPSARTRRP